MGDHSATLLTKAAALVAHYDDARGRERSTIYIIAIEERAVDGHTLLRGLGEEFCEVVYIVDADTQYGTHCGLYGFGIIYINCSV